jgi:signal transduction histidine kinase
MKSRSRLMRGLSHDVKNPLGAADGYAALLADGVFGALALEQKQSVERIRRCLRHAFALIEDLHELARAETGHLPLSPELVDLAELARASGEEYRAAADASGLSLSVEAASDPLMIETDRTRIRQIVSNLLSNAVKYTSHGSITLRVERRPVEPIVDAELWAAIDVSDTGRGIPGEKQAAIFEEFTRLGGDDTSGAGLGLAISQRLAQALGGRIAVRSEVGRGSTFTLWLPVDGRAWAMPREVAGPVAYEVRPEPRETELHSGCERGV